MAPSYLRFLCFFALCATYIYGTNIPAAEMSALQDLYDSTNGANWRWDPTTSTIGTFTSTNGVPWNFTATANPCTDQWQGLNCSFTAPFTYYHISKLVLVRHNLEGTLPPTIGNFSRLHYMNMEDNKISGTLPQTLTKLSGLLVLNLAENHFEGAVPRSLQDLSHLQEFFLDNNKLSGQLPNVFVTLANLRTISLYGNRLSGAIPSSIGSLPELTFLYLDTNHFTGTVPEALCQVTHLVDLKLQNNYLHGPIPPCLGSLHSLNLLELSNNSLTGHIPESLGALSALTILYLQENELTGSIPDTLEGMTSMLNFNVYRNKLTGTLPSGMATFTKMTNAYVHDNYLSGSLELISKWDAAVFLYLQDNLFTGSLPALTNLTKVTSIFLKNNKLSGTLEKVLDPVQNALVTTLQFSNNQFTGTLPEEIFQIAELSTFAAVSNCFIGSLPRSICSSTSLNTLILDGLHSATSCRNNILPGVANRYILEAKIEGGIPACMFAVPNINTLHLSGNGLTGTISTELGISTDLRDLSVSHNALTGSIPPLFQTKRWYNLDLSYNKFRGSLQMNYEPFNNNNTVQFYNITLTAENVALSLRNNRLSGNIPNQLKLLHNISVLDGNLFACSIDQSDLPSHDQGKSTYQCGSNSFNVSYYIWLTTTGFLILLAILIVYFRHSIGSFLRFDRIIYYYDKWMHHVEFVHDRDSVLGKDITLKNYKYLIYVCEGVCKVSIYCTAYILVVLIPIYIIGTEYYSTHNFTYAWSVSAAFLSGPIALTLLMVAFVSLLVLAFVLFTTHIRLFLREKFEFFRYTEDRIRRPSRVDENNNEVTQMEKSSIPMLMKCLVYAIFFLINFTVVLGVNVAYVYVRLYQPSSLFVIAQLLLSVFKVVWNSFCSVYIIRWVDDYLTESSSDDWKSTESGFFAIQLFVALFNYIAIPCLVVGVVSPDCYNNVLINYAPVSSRFRFAECEVFNSVLGCRVSLPQIDETSYNPPFTYSYQCSSSMITFYAPSFVYLSFIVTFISPLLELICEKWHARRVRGTFVAGQLDYWVPLILQTLELRDEPTRAKYDIFNPYLDSNLLLVTIITYLGVLLTFGVVFPPLAVCMLISILAVTFNTKLVVGRFLTNAIDTGLVKYVNIIEGECEGAGSIPKLRQCMRLLLMFCFCFYTPFLFDTLGDSVGLGGSYWVIFFLPLLGAVGISVKYALKKTFPDVLRVPEDQRYSSYSSNGARHSNNMVEMSQSVSSASANSVKSAASISPHGSPLHSVDGLEVGEQKSVAPRPSYLATPTSSPQVTPTIGSKKNIKFSGSSGRSSENSSGGVDNVTINALHSANDKV